MGYRELGANILPLGERCGKCSGNEVTKCIDLSVVCVCLGGPL
jgi:hypothetical protein